MRCAAPNYYALAIEINESVRIRFVAGKCKQIMRQSDAIETVHSS